MRKGKTEYQVSWKGLDGTNWVAEIDLDTVKTKIQEYEKSARPPKKYEVEKILKKRIQRDRLEYFVKWKNFDETTWEPLANLLEVRDVIDAFEKRQVGDWAGRNSLDLM